ncbi:4128_t:CDS:2, partial [Funneliformis caledonium]
SDLELEENDINVIYGQNVTGKAFLRLKEEQLTRDLGPFKLLFGPASAIADVVKQINGEVRKNITDAFPGGLPYMKPEPLLYTSGANWEYQPDPSLKQILRRELKKHYENFILGRFDKLNLPLYLFLSGAGTGKSRNANEFHRMAITCLSAQEDEELLTRIKEAWVFLVSYENGLALRTEESHPFFAIGTRMLFQLLRGKMMLHEIIKTFNPPDPLDVVSLIAKHHNRDLKNATVILVVDGMQQLMENKDDGLKLNSTFYKTLTSVADLAFSSTFVIPVCTSTITGPIDGMLRYSPRKRIYLPVASLQPPNYRQGDILVPVFKNDEITNTLVEDCGGHGRALEALDDCLAGRSIEECNVDTLMNDLRHDLTEKYRNAIFSTVEDARPIARAIFTKRLLNKYKPIPKTDKTPDEFVGGGLIRFEQSSSSSRRGYLTAPYIWLWIFMEISNEEGDPLLRDWEFADYGEQRAFLNPVTSLQAKSWQSFEKFVASFRCIKSTVIEEDELINISEVHAGARLNGDIQFKNHNLQLEIAKHHTDTNSKNHTANEWNVECYNSTVDVRKFKHCIINAPASPYGDSFLSLDQPGTESPNEIHQFKLRKKAVSQKEYHEEREKSASENDFFILFTTANCNIKIPKRSGIVDKKAFTNYFGPFAGRAYRSAMANPSIYNKVKNIHTVSLGQICVMNQISKERVYAKTKIAMKNFYFRKGLHMISRILLRFM